MSGNHKDECSCDYCSAKRIYTEELQKSAESTVAGFIQSHNRLPEPEALATFLDDEVKSCAVLAFTGLVEKLVNLGYLPDYVLQRVQNRQAQQQAAEPVTPYTTSPGGEKKLN